MNINIVTVATGPIHLRLARCLVRSLAAHGVDAPVTILADEDTDWTPPAHVHLLRLPQKAQGFASRDHKTGIYKHVGKPGGQIVFLDADMLLLRPLGGLEADLHQAYAMRLRAPSLVADPAHVAEAVDTVAEAGPSARHWDSGLIAWTRTKATDDLFDAWNAAWKERGARDEFALIRAQHRVGLHPSALPGALNSRNIRTAVLWHHHIADPAVVEAFCVHRGW